MGRNQPCPKVTDMPLLDLIQKDKVGNPDMARKVFKCLSMPLSLEIMNRLSPGRAMRYNEIRKSLGIRDTKSLSRALRALASLGLVMRTVIPSTPPAVAYEITSSGKIIVENAAIISEQAGILE